MSNRVRNPPPGLSPLVELLRCIECGAPVKIKEIAAGPGYQELGPDGWLECTSCGERYPVIGGTPRMLDRTARAELRASYPATAIELPPPGAEAVKNGSSSIMQRTADSFAYEWRHFGRPRAEWQQNFVGYMRPHGPGFFRDKLVLDVGTGSGRHSAQAAALNARVVAVDLGRSVDVARRNLPHEVLTVQADAERLPFAPGVFDFVMSIGVLHHLPDTERAFRSLVPVVAPGGRLHIYVYWVPERAFHRHLLRLVAAIRPVTTRLPYRVLHPLCYPLAAFLWLSVVAPYRALRNRPRGRRVAEALPLKTYADYPFGVLVNDQFDRFSAPIEHRYTRSEVESMLKEAGLTEVTVIPNAGWIGDGRVPGINH